MPAGLKHGETPELEVARVDVPFFGAVENGDNAPEGRRFLEFGEKVDNEADAGVK